MKKILIYMFAGMFLLTGCDLDINENPNYPSSEDITPDLMFPAAVNAIADCVGDQMFNYAGYFAQYFDQAPTANQYNDLAELKIDEGSDPSIGVISISIPVLWQTFKTFSAAKLMHPMHLLAPL